MATKDFEIVDRPKPEEEQEADEVQNDILWALLHDKDVTREIETKRGTFRVKYPTPADNARINYLVAQHKQGLPVHSYDENVQFDHLVWATLDVIVIDRPEWAREFDSFQSCPDNKLVADLFSRSFQFREDVRAAIDESRLGIVDRTSESRSPAADVADGAFSGVAVGSSPGSGNAGAD